jgi:geranylgeranyl diphosphate synthase type II
MDNDEYRRGKKTTWVVYGDGMAVLAGDGLLNYAYETMLKAVTMSNEADMIKTAKAASVLARKAGIYGMIGGQTADLEAENMGGKVTKEHMLFIHEHKTAALIQASMMVGAILAGATQGQIDLIEKAAYEIGVAFQIQDDILDVTSTLETLGKPIGSDEKNNKTTYVTLKGLDEAAKEQKDMSNHAVGLIKSLEEDGFKNDFLVELIRSLITRIK